jgi:hypothetical protein
MEVEKLSSIQRENFRKAGLKRSMHTRKIEFVDTESYKSAFYFIRSYLNRKFSQHNNNPVQTIWEGNAEKDTNIDVISSLFSAKKISGQIADFVDDTTWADLDMDEVFHKIDRSTSPPGRQYLYYSLRANGLKNGNDPFKTYQFFIQNPEIRENIQRLLMKLNRPSVNYLVNLLYSDLPQKPKYHFLFPILSIALAAAIVITFFYKFAFLAVLTLVIINLSIHYIYSYKVMSFLPDLHDLNELLKTTSILCKTAPINEIPQIGELSRYEHIARSIRKKIGWSIMNPAHLDVLSGSVIEYVNCFFLFNIISFFRSVDELRENQANLVHIHDTVGSLDAAISGAAYLNSLPFYCKPELNGDSVLDIREMYHPLLKNPVANTFSLQNNSCLISGSNMAGKTVFLKTIGLNIILARNLCICLAESANFPNVSVRTTIKRSDAIYEEKSYYFKEIETILTFLHLSSESGNFIFLIDEIFRGTNTLERISAATAVLEYLSRKNMVMVTTHDIELQNLLKSNFEMYHFTEEIKNNKHHFDYKIKTGPCNSRNAIKLMELMGYPKAVTDHALEITKKLSN